MAIVVVAAALVALAWFAIDASDWTSLLLGLLIALLMLLALANYRLLWATRREMRRRLRRQELQLAGRHAAMRAQLAKLEQQFSGALKSQELLGSRILQADRSREARTAAQFDWIARRYRQQEATLDDFLRDQRVDQNACASELNALVRGLADKLDAATTSDARSNMDKLDEVAAVVERASANIASADLAHMRSRLDQIRSHQLLYGTRKKMLAEVSALLSVYLDSPRPAPVLGDWSMAPRSLDRMRREVVALAPQTIVELGSGASTPFLSIWAEKARPGATVLSIEHHPNYLAQTQSSLDQIEANNTRLELVPLAPVEVGGTTFQWYKDVPEAGDIDLLVVDGPPEATGEMARYPAVPQLANRLRVGSVVLLDDADRPGEQRAIKLWTSQSWHGRRLELIDLVDTLAILRVTSIDTEAEED